jgi:hypothetical protein
MLSSLLPQKVSKNAEEIWYPLQENMLRKGINTTYLNDVNTHHTPKPGKSEQWINLMKKDYNRWNSILE